ncbi:MAG: hypothetical protein ACRD5K_03060 [Candidatus Acidiferrales bacterium]
MSRCYKREMEFELARLHLEAGRAVTEIARLRDENRALLDSILGIAGIPPVSTSFAEVPRSEPTHQSGPEASATANPADNTRSLGTPGNSGPVSPSFRFTGAKASANNLGAARVNNLSQIAPVRRRSWQQINRTLELEAARKKPSETET